MYDGLAHVTVTVPEGDLDRAVRFYTETIGLQPRPVPQLQKHELAWFDIGTSGQQLHIAFGANSDLDAVRHLCFKVETQKALLDLQVKLWEHHKRGDDTAPLSVDTPGVISTGPAAQGVEYPERFFARDFAGNRLEFSL
ncbi:hypothetical protein K4K55_005033 [Colletotrichum sp. SAR 10_96]|nr:hypothetical protein K4K55_005033 [Colletotrichum sp. SAR 10_96]